MDDTVLCPCGRGNAIEVGRTTCYRCRVASVGFGMRAPAVDGDFHRSKSEFMQEHFGTTDDRELGKRGIERVQ